MLSSKKFKEFFILLMGNFSREKNGSKKEHKYRVKLEKSATHFCAFLPIVSYVLYFGSLAAYCY